MKSRSLGLFLGTALAWALVAAPAADAQSRQGFRVTKLNILDPHIFLDVFGTGSCSNITNPPGLLGINVNGLVQEFIDECAPVGGSPEPCVSDFNLVAVFEPLIQTPGAGGALEECMFEGNPCTFTIGLIDACTRDGGTVDCDGELGNASITTFSNAGTGVECLGALPGTTGPNNVGNYTPPVVATDGPCGVSGEIDLTLSLGSDVAIVIPLKGMTLAAQYDGDPATGLIKGLGRGFLSEAAADAISIEVTDPVPLSIALGQVLPGADKCIGGLNDGLTCTNAAGCPADPEVPAPTCVEGRCVGGANEGRSCTAQTVATACPATRCQVSCAPAGFGGPPTGTAQDDRDTGPGGESGWWFYIGFEAEAVGVPEPPEPTATPTPDVPPTDTPVPPTPTDTPTPTHTPVPPTPTDTPVPPTPTATPTPPLPACPGDCNDDGEVTIGEVQTAAGIFLGTLDVASCLAADRNRDEAVTIGEVVRAVGSFRLGCP